MNLIMFMSVHPGKLYCTGVQNAGERTREWREVETKGASSATTMTANKQPLSAATNRQKLKTVGIPLHVRDAAKATPSSPIATNLVCPMVGRMHREKILNHQRDSLF